MSDDTTLQCPCDEFDYELETIVDVTPEIATWLKPLPEQRQKVFIMRLHSWTVLAIEVNTLLEIRSNCEPDVQQALDTVIAARKLRMLHFIQYLEFNGQCTEQFRFHVYGKYVTTSLNVVVKDDPPSQNDAQVFVYVPVLEHVDPFVLSKVRANMRHHVWNHDIMHVTAPPNWEEPRTHATSTRVAWEPVVCAVAIVLCLFVLFVLWGLTREQ